MRTERRTAPRSNARLLCNQYIDGTPHLGEALELSVSGALVRRVIGTSEERACYALELGTPDKPEERVFVCATSVWREGDLEALRFVAQSDRDRARLAALLRSLN